MKFKWSKENQKLIKTQKAWKKRYGRDARFISFNIPQLKSESGKMTCPYAGWCADVCYASQGRFTFSTARALREHNLALIEEAGSSLGHELAADLRRMRKITHVRIHDSGDFFSRAYYKQWVEIAKLTPDVIFYAYTKSIPFIDWDSHPDNFRVVQSFGGLRDSKIDLSKPHSKIFSTHEERKAAGYIDGNVDDIPAVIRNVRIGLVYHGVRHLKSNDLVNIRSTAEAFQ